MAQIVSALLAACAAGLYLAVLGPVIGSALPENDLWWMMPMMRQYVEGGQLLDVLKFLFSPAPISLGQPLLKLYLLPAAVFGWSIGALIGVAVVFHFLNALLIGGVGRLLGLSHWISFSAAAVYLSLFAHFHSVLWPTAAQHLMAVFSILAVLWLYLKTEERAAAGAPWRGLFLLVLAVGAVASLGRSAILAPILIAAHLLMESRSPQERLSRFDRWRPLFLLFLVYPAFMLSYIGDVIINDKIVSLNVPAILKSVGLIGLGAAALGLFRFAIAQSGRWAGWKRWVWAGIPLIWAALMVRDHRQILLPYNLLVPWTALWTSFLDPFQSALRMDSTEPYHYLSAQISPFFLALSAAGAGIFLGVFASKKKALWFLPVWYAVCLIHVLNHYGSFPVRIPSRYFIYFSPVFAWVFCAVGWWLVDNAGLRAGWSAGLRRWIWGAGLAAFCVTNLLAIRLELFRGKLVNTYLAYDDLRVSDSPSADFGRQAESGLQNLDRQDSAGARAAFLKGVEQRPFFLRYLLGNCRLSDARWVTGGQGIRKWVDEVGRKYRDWDMTPAEGASRIQAIMAQELLDYAVCLLGLASIETNSGRKDQARRWISQLYFLERDPELLREWLKTDERVRQRAYLAGTLKDLENPLVFRDPMPWQKDDYGFGRFMARLIFGLDLRSGYDRMSMAL